MYLKRLESVGFKSFAEQINVDFVPGVTAVVGPNGSGKSNITDALRWVLGEQSAKSLRGSKMEDIIFQGSDTRKPLNIAEVTLILDNTDHTVALDYNEVSITRRMFRSGESEFYMNKQPCRLKDIIELFMGSGLGKEAFSIIGQGKVEEILSSKSEERRVIFEEAAGVLKYKQRKKKAEYKLLETQENLSRVEDIIHEINVQQTPLKEQANTAQLYLEKKDILKKQEVSLLVTEIEQLTGRWTTLKKELEQDREKEKTLQQTIQEKETVIAGRRAKIQHIDVQIEKWQTSLLSITQKLEQFEGQKNLLHERSQHVSANKAELESAKQTMATKIDELKQQRKDEKSKLANLMKEYQNTKEKAATLEEQLTTSHEDIEHEIDELKADYIEYLNERAAKRNERQSIKQQLEQNDVKKDRQTAQFAKTISSRDQLKQQYEQVSKHLRKQKKITNQIITTIHDLKNRLEKNQEHYQKSQTKLYQGYQYLEKLKSKKEMLEEMKEDFQGFFAGVKEVLKAREEKVLQGIDGAVIELINVPKQYITAIETTLGGSSQHIVVQHDQAARKAIQWLKQTKKGRATFLPLSSIQERSIPNNLLEKARHQQGFVGIAGELVTCQSHYKKVVKHLMGNVIIAETLKDANEIAATLNRRYRVVTLDGDMVNPGGSMSGGARRKTNQSLFTRDKELRDITEKLTLFNEKSITFEQEISKQKQGITQMKGQLENQQTALNKEREKQQIIQADKKEIEVNQANVNDYLSIYDQDKRQFSDDEAELRKREQTCVNHLTTIEEKLTAIQKRLDQLAVLDSQFKDNQEQKQHTLQQLRITIAEQEERLKHLREKVKLQHNQLTDMETEQNRNQQRLTEILKVERNEVTEVSINQSLQELETQKQDIINDMQQIRDKRKGHVEHIDTQNNELMKENECYHTLTESIQQKLVDVNRLDVELENRLQILQSEYTLTFERAKKQFDKVVEIDKADQQVSELKASIKDLGVVNLGAIDEYRRVSERFDFLTEQQTDLLKAKETLYTAIAEMDSEMEQRFEETFLQIKHEFTMVFKELFGGGYAELKMTDPDHLLETGIDIIAEPPGKKLRHLGLLSGGERALTAIALLFAILRVRPVPFCVLDEVEAALDEANVARFAKYVKMYSEKTQFIIITHRKGTMEESDVLYGVTMQESGVSRLVSVRLEDTKELVEI